MVIKGSRTREPPNQDISINNEINNPLRILIKYKNLDLLEIIKNGRKVNMIKRKKITFIPRSLFGILLNIA